MKKLQLIFGIALVLWSRALLKLGLRKPRDGWRRGAGLVLRGEAARFVLSAFHLDAWSDEPVAIGRTIEQTQEHLRKRLAEFLGGEPDFHILIRHDAEADRVAPHSGASYTLGFEQWVDGPGRFIRPDSWIDEAGTFAVAGASPVFEFIGRINSDHQADLWVRINHVGSDGVPVQEMLLRLEKAWGARKGVVFPSREEFEPHETARPSPGRSGTVEVQTFIDFGKVLGWRKRRNGELPEPMTFSAAILWWLGQHPVFAKLYLGTTVEIPQVNGLGKGVGVVVVRPEDYFSRPDGLGQYVKEFNRQLGLARQRRNEGCKTLDAAAYLPAGLEETLLRYALDQGTSAFGSVGLTILKDAKVFGAPLGDTGHVNGFIAIGGVSVESTDGKRVGCVVTKGPKEKISAYARVLREAMDKVEDT